ncbi:hypothetical protein BJ508DRAFT_308803 [Ascobolus immersus RN42]|uniref:Uncharacterized protein n=1 Tax=Ascobolus immersus RN42 TaxID=1160509 RepID=A0A3N4I0H5_ASCIM|nr:hypothetical protein BJ508DRAFT_308803 [Ascobolus immersus RN42]
MGTALRLISHLLAVILSIVLWYLVDTRSAKKGDTTQASSWLDDNSINIIITTTVPALFRLVELLLSKRQTEMARMAEWLTIVAQYKQLQSGSTKTTNSTPPNNATTTGLDATAPPTQVAIENDQYLQGA